MACILLERTWPGVRDMTGKWAANMAAGLVTVLVQLTMPFWSAVETSLVNLGGGGWVDLSQMPLWLGAAIYLLFADLGEYLFHRAQHRFRWMWSMHSLHHSDNALNTATALRHFWFEPLIKSISIWLIVALLFRASPEIIIIYGFVSYLHFFNHSNVRFGLGRFSWLLNSPQYHRLHHSLDPTHHNANFASLFPIFDCISGSYHRPAKNEFPPTGLSDDAVGSAFEVLVWPFRASTRRSNTKVSTAAATMKSNHVQ